VQKLVARLRMFDEQDDRGADHNADEEISHCSVRSILIPSLRAFCRTKVRVRWSFLAIAFRSCTFVSVISLRSAFIDQLNGADFLFAMANPGPIIAR
jgi:hypothetical protein